MAGALENRKYTAHTSSELTFQQRKTRLVCIRILYQFDGCLQEYLLKFLSVLIQTHKAQVNLTDLVSEDLFSRSTKKSIVEKDLVSFRKIPAEFLQVNRKRIYPLGQYLTKRELSTLLTKQ